MTALLLLHREGQQHVARHTETAVSRDHVEPAVDDGRPGTVERAAVGLDAVDGFELTGGVEVPDDTPGSSARNSTTARRSAALRALPNWRMTPLVMAL